MNKINERGLMLILVLRPEALALLIYAKRQIGKSFFLYAHSAFSMVYLLMTMDSL